ncbi:MAG TPA: murein biosynthesis integral membrane protein MurJ [Alphaproteobacteria bacterium]|nr:murein biosynthesis integral membrane protein MurJ [Alphaproteobacteria bacterium]
MALFRAIATVGSFTMASRMLGFARDVLIAAYIGTGPVADAFFVAFKFPNFFRRLFAEGAFNAAFVPSFAGIVATRGRAAARAFAEDTLAVLLAVLFALLVLAEATMPWLMTAIAPGFVGDPAKFALAVEFTRITFPYLLFISLVSLQGGVLNSLDRFAAVAATPIVLNLVLIASLLGFAALMPSAGHALAWGVALAGVAQFLWLAEACRRAGMALGLPRPRLSPEVRRMLTLMLPAAIGSGVVQINLVIDVIIASLLPTGSVSYLYYADRIYELPLAVIGIAIGTALLPALARQVRRGEDAAALSTQNRGLEAALLLTLPAAAALVVLARPIIAVLFERGAFGGFAVDATAAALQAYALGLPAYVLIKVLTPGFYAREDTATPVKIAIACVVANTALALILMRPLAHVGIALASALAAWLNAALLALMLKRRGAFAPDVRLGARLPRMIAATIVMAALLWGLAQPLAPWLAAGLAHRAGALALLVAGGLVCFALAAQALKATDFRDLMRQLGAGS